MIQYSVRQIFKKFFKEAYDNQIETLLLSLQNVCGILLLGPLILFH